VPARPGSAAARARSAISIDPGGRSSRKRERIAAGPRGSERIAGFTARDEARAAARRAIGARGCGDLSSTNALVHRIVMCALVQLARELLCAIAMTKRFVIVVVVLALPLAAVVLSIAALVLIPRAIVLVPLALLLAVAALPAILVRAARGAQPGGVPVAMAAVASSAGAPAMARVPAA
jgi:hypothetical protein